MKKYRIIKFDYDECSTYHIQKRFLFFWWISLNSTGGYAHDFPYTYSNLEEARTAIRRFNPKKTIIEEV